MPLPSRPPADGAPRTERRARATPLAALVAVALLHYWRFGYAYGTGDHDELLPPVLRRLDAGLFERDWYVMSQSAGVTVRTAFVEGLHVLALAVPLPVAVAVLHAVVLLATLWGVYRLGLLFVPDRLGALVGTAAATVLLAPWTLGGNTLTYGMLVPEAIGWALVLPALRLFAQGRRLPAAVLLGLAVWFQALVGVLTAGALGLVALGEAATGPARAGALGRAVLFGAVFAGVAAPLLVPVLLAPGFEVRSSFDPFYVMAELRVPHHYLPSAFGMGPWMRFGAVAVAGGLGAWGLRRSGRLQHGPFAARFLSVCVAFGLVGVLCTEVVPVLAVAELQLFKLSVLATTVLVLLAAHAAVGALPERLRSAVAPAISGALPRAGGAGLAALTAGLLVAGAGRPAAVYEPRQYEATPLADAEHWVRTHTPRDALFAIPPSNTTFRVHARRAVVVNFKPVPFQHGGAQVWLARLRDLAPAPLPRQGGLGWQSTLDAAYGRHDAVSWTRLRTRYGLDFALVEAERAPADLPVVYRNARWAVVDVARGGEAAGRP